MHGRQVIAAGPGTRSNVGPNTDPLMHPRHPIACWLCVLVCLPALGQYGNAALSLEENHAHFWKEESTFEASLFTLAAEQEVLGATHANVLAKAAYLRIDTTALAALLATTPELVRLRIPTNNGPMHEVDLVRYGIRSPNATTGVRDAEGYRALSVDLGLHYRGLVEGEGGWAAVSITNQGIAGMMVFKDGNKVLGALKDDPTGTTYVLYDDHDLVPSMPFSCGMTDDVYAGIAEHPHTLPNAAAKGGGCFLKLFWIGDYDLYVACGYDGPTALTYLAGIFNNVAALYQNEGIPLLLGDLYVFTVPDLYDEWDSWAAFQTFGAQVSTEPNFDEDLAMCLNLIVNSNYTSLGIIDALCSSFVPQQPVAGGRFAYSRIEGYYEGVPLYSWTVSVAAHEMGHNVGSRHTHWCGWPPGALDNCNAVEPDDLGFGCLPGPYPTDGGTIMSYCHNLLGSINFYNGFGYYPHQEIINDLYSASCMCFSGINDRSAPEMTLAPVPADGVIHLDIASQGIAADWQYFISDATGRVLAQGGPTRSIDVSRLPTGYYSMHVRSSSWTRALRFEILR